MTELYILDQNFEIIGLIDGFTTLEWIRRCYTCGEFTLTIQGSDRLSDLRNGSFIYRADTAETALIESVTLEYKQNIVTVCASGRTLEALLSSRVIPTAVQLSGNAETVIRELIASNAISDTAAGRGIPALVLGDANNVVGETAVQFMGDNLLTAVHSICVDQELFIKAALDYQTNTVTVSICRGLDRTTDQTENSWAIFSDNFENINSARYQKSSTRHKNFAYIYGVAADDSEILLELDHIRDGDVRRELFVNATSVKQRSNGVLMSLTEFKKLLLQRGSELLAEYSVTDSVKGSVQNGGSLVYRRDFDLGDLCEYIDNTHSIISRGRILEIREFFDSSLTDGAVSADPVVSISFSASTLNT